MTTDTDSPQREGHLPGVLERGKRKGKQLEKHRQRLRLDREPTAREKALLLFIGEQMAVTVGQLSDFAGVEREEIEKKAIPEFEDARWITSKQFITGDDVWVWLRERGAKLTGARFCRYRAVQFTALAHYRTLTDARLWLESNYEVRRWECERELLSYVRTKGQRQAPDGVAVVMMDDGNGPKEFEIAVEAEISMKTEAQWEEKFDAYDRKYGGYLYFVSPEVASSMERLELADRYPKLEVRVVSKPPSLLTHSEWQVPGDPPMARMHEKRLLKLPISESDLAVIDLALEQETVPMDQLRRFADLHPRIEATDPEEIERLVFRLVKFGLLRRAKPLVDEPSWVWSSRAGQRLSRHEVNATIPGLGGLEFLRGFNEARLRFMEDRPDAEWESGRVIRHEHGRKGSLPDAVVQIGSERHAVEVFIGYRTSERMQSLLDQRLEDYEGAMWFHSEFGASAVEKFAEENERRPLKVVRLPPLRHKYEIKGQATAGIDTPRRRKSRRRAYKKEVITVRPVAVSSLRPEVLQVVATASGLDRVPEVVDACAQPGPGKLFLIETVVGPFMVTSSPFGWNATETDPARFVKEADPVARAREEAMRRMEEGPPPQHELSDAAWAELKPEVPKRPACPGSHRRRSDRLIVDGALFVLRYEISWRQLPKELGYGSYAAIQRGLKAWQETEEWDPFLAAWVELVPDSDRLDWPRLAGAPLRYRWQREEVERRGEDDAG
jgi:hypothetical protein